MLRREAWVLVAASYALMLFAHLWPADFRNPSPAYACVAWTAFMVRTFAFHLGIILLLSALVAAWARKWRLLAAAVPLVVFTVGPACRQFLPRSTPSVTGETVTVMSVNLLALNRDTRPIIEEIKGSDPDILLLQEYTDHWHQALQAAIGRNYPHTSYRRREDSFGTGIYSKRPFEEPVAMHVPLGQAAEPQIRAVIRIANRPVAFYNVHLRPPSGLEYIIEHRTQLADLAEALSAEQLPVVLGGDFNFTENSPHAGALRRQGLRDAHSLGGWGRGATWPVHSVLRWVPGLRLDHLYLGGGLTCVECRTGVGQGSDHRPVIAEVGFAP